MIGLGMIVGGLVKLGGGLISAYNKSKDVSIAAIESTVGIAKAQAEYSVQVLGHPLSPLGLMQYSLALYFIKCVAIDTVICPMLGYEMVTAPLKGGTYELALIIAGTMSFSHLANMIKR